MIEKSSCILYRYCITQVLCKYKINKEIYLSHSSVIYVLLVSGIYRQVHCTFLHMHNINIAVYYKLLLYEHFEILNICGMGYGITINILYYI